MVFNGVEGPGRFRKIGEAEKKNSGAELRSKGGIKVRTCSSYHYPLLPYEPYEPIRTNIRKKTTLSTRVSSPAFDSRWKDLSSFIQNICLFMQKTNLGSIHRSRILYPGQHRRKLLVEYVFVLIFSQGPPITPF